MIAEVQYKPIQKDSTHYLDKIELSVNRPRPTISEGQRTLRKRVFKKWDTLTDIQQILADRDKIENEIGQLPKWFVKRITEVIPSCQQIILLDGYKVRSSFCHYGKECHVCRAKKIAERISKYEPILSTFKDLQFVTLTRRAIDGKDSIEDLTDILSEFKRNWSRVRANVSHRYNLKGIIATEISTTVKRKNWHVHAHLLVDGADVAEAIKKYWLDQNPTALKENQVIKKADPDSIKEVIKYVTKCKIGKDGVTSTTMTKIFIATKGRNLFNDFGLSDLKTKEKPKHKQLRVTHKGYISEIYQYRHDLIDHESADGELLAEHDTNDKQYQYRKLKTNRYGKDHERTENNYKDIQNQSNGTKETHRSIRSKLVKDST